MSKETFFLREQSACPGIFTREKPPIVLGKFFCELDEIQKLRERVHAEAGRLRSVYFAAESELKKQDGRLHEFEWKTQQMQKTLELNSHDELMKDRGTYLAMFAQSAAQDLGIEIGTVPREDDGPCGINEWTYGGKRLQGEMTPKQWKLAKYLWKRRKQKVPLNDLIGDQKMFIEDIERETVKKHGSGISLWFKEKEIPIKVSSEGDEIWMAIEGK